MNQNQERQGSLELLKSEGLGAKGGTKGDGQGQESKAGDAVKADAAKADAAKSGKPAEKSGAPGVFNRPRASVLAKPSCPNCASDRCPASKGADETPSAVIRYRRCSKCGHSFKTVAAVKDGMVGPERVAKS